MIELDVQLSRDDELIVIHDWQLERTTDGIGRVRDTPLADLRKLDCGSWFSPAFAGAGILTLGEVLDLVAGRARLNVEIKSPEEDWPTLVPSLVDTLVRHRALDSTLVSCFEPEALSLLRNHSSEVALGLLWHQFDLDRAWAWAKTLGAAAIHPHHLLVSNEMVARAHEAGLQVIVWTVNVVESMRELLDLQVDGIISDHPERLMALK